MRAFMSRIRTRPIESKYLSGWDPFSAAEVEARRIVAETEPTGYPDGENMAYHCAIRGGAWMGDTREALADALRAWLGEGEAHEDR